jgi:GlpG protein
MRPIGQLESEEQARVFADYLYIREIAAEVESAGDKGWTIWVVDEDQVDEGRALLSRFRSMPDAEEFYQASAAAESRRQGEQKQEQAEAVRTEPVRAWSGVLGRASLTTALLIGCIVVGLLTRLGEDATWVRWLQISNLTVLDPSRLGISLVEVEQGQVWRLLTPIFLHFSLWHLLFNLLWMQDLGMVLEERIGTWRYAGVVLLVALVSNMAQYVAGGANFGGMSGVVYGIFGYLWIRSRRDFDFRVFVSPTMAGILMIFLGLGVFGVLGPTANAAHFSGLLTGGALGWLASLRKGV